LTENDALWYYSKALMFYVRDKRCAKKTVVLFPQCAETSIKPPLTWLKYEGLLGMVFLVTIARCAFLFKKSDRINYVCVAGRL